MDFDDFRKNNPEARFSDYYVAKLRDLLAEGQPHGGLGKLLSQKGEPVDFEAAGRPEFEKYLNWFALTPQDKVLDYGCGSLRVGLHFIRFLEPGNYFGLDLTDDFFRSGIEVLNERLGTDWQARLGIIANSLQDGVEFAADFVFSSNVAYHVHPDECGEYFAHLSQLAGKTGAKLCFDSRVSPQPVRFGDRNWAHPFDYCADMLPSLRLMRTFPPREKVEQMMSDQAPVRVIYHFEK